MDTLVLKLVLTDAVMTKVNNFFEETGMLAGKYSMLIERFDTRSMPDATCN